MGSSLNNILPAVLGGAASLIPGVGAIAGPVVGGIASSIFGGGGSSGASGGSGGASAGFGQSPYSVDNSLANLAQMVGPASAAMQVANSNKQLANDLQNNALGGEGNATTNAVNSLRSLYSQMPAPGSGGLPLSQVSPATLASVMGRAPGLLPRINSPQQNPYATQIAQMAALPGGQQTFAQPQAGQAQAALPVTTGSPAAGAVTNGMPGGVTDVADPINYGQKRYAYADPNTGNTMELTRWADGTYTLSDPDTGQDGAHAGYSGAGGSDYRGGSNSIESSIQQFDKQYGKSVFDPWAQPAPAPAPAPATRATPQSFRSMYGAAA